MNLLSKNPCHDLKDIFKICLTLSDGNACVKSGFSMNKEILEVYMKESSLVAQIFVYKEINCKRKWHIQSWYQQKVTGKCEKTRRYSMIADEDRKKAQTEGDKKHEERKWLSNKIQDLQASKKPGLIHLHKPQMHLMQNLTNYKTNLKNNYLHLLLLAWKVTTWTCNMGNIFSHAWISIFHF